jgi:branched-chain amino acid transport system permease protein
MQQIVNGLFIGSVYGLFAVGYTLVFGVLKQLNLAHAMSFTWGAIAGLWTFQKGAPLPAAFLAAVGTGMIIGILLDKFIFGPLIRRGDSHLSGLVASVGLSLVLSAIALAVFGADTERFPADAFPDKRFTVGGVTFTVVQLAVAGTAIGLVLLLTWTIKSTKYGRGLRAVSENVDAARILGINVQRITLATFALSSALGAIAGMLFALAFNVVYLDMGADVELKGIAAMIIGGLGSVPGALIGGLIIGMAEVLSITHISSEWKDGITFFVLFIVLLVRPQGILSRLPGREL